MSNDARQTAFERIKNVLSEIAVLRDDLAELKTEYVGATADPIPPETWGDLVALARTAVMDASKRAKADTARKRRDELAGQLGLDL